MENSLLLYSNPIPGHRQTTSLSFDSSYSHQQCQQSKYNPLHLSASVEMAFGFTTSKGFCELPFTGGLQKSSKCPDKSINCSVQFSLVTQLSPTLCNLPVHHQLLEFTQTHVHWVCDASQPSHPLLSPSPPTFNFSQHHGLFKWASSSHQVAKYWSFSFIISPSNEHSGLISFRMD